MRGTASDEKSLYEALEALATRDGGLGSQDVDRLVQAVKRSLINPGSQTARDLMKAVTRYDTVRSARVQPDPLARLARKLTDQGGEAAG